MSTTITLFYNCNNITPLKSGLLKRSQMFTSQCCNTFLGKCIFFQYLEIKKRFVLIPEHAPSILKTTPFLKRKYAPKRLFLSKEKVSVKCISACERIVSPILVWKKKISKFTRFSDSPQVLESIAK